MARTPTLLESIDDFLTGGMSTREAQTYDEARQLWDDARDPSYEALLGGNYDPTELGPTAFERISTDPAFRSAMMDALSNIRNVATSGGLTAQDRAKMAQSDAERLAQERSIQQTAANNARMRGATGSGIDEMRAATESQGAANSGNMRDLQMQSEALQRSMDAFNRMGSMGQSFQSQEFGQQAQLANARDMVDRFNAENSNQASQFNIQNRSRAAQGQFENQNALRSGRTGAIARQGQMYGDRAQGARDFWGGLLDRGLSAATMGLGGIGGGGQRSGGAPRRGLSPMWME